MCLLFEFAYMLLVICFVLLLMSPPQHCTFRRSTALPYGHLVHCFGHMISWPTGYPFSPPGEHPPSHPPVGPRMEPIFGVHTQEQSPRAPISPLLKKLSSPRSFTCKSAPHPQCSRFFHQHLAFYCFLMFANQMGYSDNTHLHFRDV